MPDIFMQIHKKTKNVFPMNKMKYWKETQDIDYIYYLIMQNVVILDISRLLVIITYICYNTKIIVYK